MPSTSGGSSILDLVRDLPGVHVAGSSRGSKAHLLNMAIPTPTPASVPEPLPLSRRGFLQLAAASAGAVAWSVCSPGMVSANPFLWFAGTVVASAIGWVVGKALDYVSSKLTTKVPAKYPQTEVELGLKSVPTPAPSSDRFHNTYAPNYVITNHNWHITPIYFPAYDVRFGVGEYLLVTDMNCVEIFQIQREEQFHGGILLPGGLRRPYNRLHDGRSLQDTARRYDAPVRDEEVAYVQTEVDSQGKLHTGFGVNRGDKAQFLLS